MTENHLFIVGIGPGSPDKMSLTAYDALRQSKYVVGYRAYLDLVKDLAAGKGAVSTGMGGEVERARQAVSLLSEGSVSLISSGDPNVYGMAGLGLEMAKRYAVLHKATVVPGVTAFSAAANAAGVSFREGVAVVSLSDLLTSWDEISRRIELASMLEMPIAIYNPKSKKRDWQLQKALSIRQEILEADSSGQPSILVARNVSRQEESVTWTTHDMIIDGTSKVDMFSILILEGRGMTRGDPSDSTSLVSVVGAGPGGERHLTLQSKELLLKSDIVLGPSRYLKNAASLIEGKMEFGLRSKETESRRIPTADDESDAKTSQSIDGADVASAGLCRKCRTKASRSALSWAAKAKMLSLSGRKVCILAGGDPSLFSSSWRISEGRRISPGISAFSAISAKAGAPIANDFIIISGADRKSLAALPSLIEADYTVVIYNLAMDAISDIMGHVPPKRPTALGMDLTRNEEQFFIGTALEIAEDCARLKGNRWTLLVSASRADLTKGVIIGKRGYESRYDF